MRVWFALSGNFYSQSLFKLVAPESVVKLSHRSNARSIFEKLIAVTKIFAVVILRLLCVIARGEFLMCIPHRSGNYQRLLRLLRPNAIAVIDDGITFEYWSNFHECNVKPILLDKRCKFLIGPRVPNWPEKMCENYTLIQCSRDLVVTEMVGKKIFPMEIKDSIGDQFFIFLDDGRFESAEILSVKNFLKKKYGVKVLVVAHPTRKRDESDEFLRLNIPVESFVLSFSNGIVGVFGKGSTALFNIASVTRSLVVLSLRTAVEGIDSSMENAGIKLVTLESMDAA